MQGAVLINHNPWADVSSNKDGQADITVFKGAAQIEIRSMGLKASLLDIMKFFPEEYSLSGTCGI